MTEVAALGLRVDGVADVERASRAMDGLSRASGGAERSTDGLTGALRDEGRAADSASRSTDQFAAVARKAAATVAAAFSARALLQYADAWTNINNRLRLVTDSATAFATAQRGIIDIAMQTRQPLEASAELYQRIAMNQRELGLSGQEVIDVTRTISQAMVVSGTSAQGAQAALVQLGQAFASGVLRGEEFNSVMEQAPGLAQAIAAGMGVAVGELRALAGEGKLTADVVIDALQSQAGAVNDAFSQMTPTIGQALTNLNTAMLQMVGRMDEASGASSRLAEGIIAIADAMGGTGAVSRALITLSAEFTDLGDIIGYNMARSSLAIEAFIAKNTFQAQKYAQITRQMAQLDKARTEQREDMERRLAALLDDREEAESGLVEVMVRAKPVVKDLSVFQDALAKSYQEAAKAAADFDKAIRDVLESTYPYIRVARQHNEQLEVMRAALRAGKIEGEQFNDWLRTAQGELLPEITVQIERVSTAIPQVGANATEAATTFTRGVERMRDAMGDFFTDLIVDGKASFSRLVDLFKRMIAEMVATAAANRILVGVGMMSSTQAMASGGMLGGGGGGFGMGGLPGGLQSAITGGLQAIGTGLSNIGLTGAGDIAYSLGLQAGTSGVLGAISAAAPWVAGGLALASAFGLFDKKPSDKRQYASGSFGGTDQILTGFSGNKFSQENQDAAAVLLGMIQGMGAAIGGTTAAGSVSVGGRTGLRLSTGQGESSFREFATEAELLEAAWREVLQGATALEPVVKQLTLAFEGNADAGIEYARTLQAVWDATGRNGATQASQDYAAAQRTLTEVYSASTANVRQLAVQFDGSAASVSALAGALGENQQLAYQLAMQFNQVRDSVSGMLGGLAESIRTSLMSQDELYAYQSRQVDALATALQGMTDPAQIMQTTQQFEQLVSGMWGRLSEEQRQEMGGGFLDTISDFEALAAQRIEAGSKAAEESQRVTGEIIQQGIRDAAAELQQSAASYQLSAQTIQQAAQMFMQAAQAQMRGGEVNS